MGAWNIFSANLPAIIVIADFFLAAWVSYHAVLYKRDTRAVITWLGLAWLAPFVGALAYFLLGINRVQRSAAALELRKSWQGREKLALTCEEQEYRDAFAKQHPQLIRQALLVHNLTSHQLAPGNLVTLLENGDEAYPAMLAAIAEAQYSISLLSYIFDSDRAGEVFFQALCAAQHRGVEVRILIDAVGARYSQHNMVDQFKRAGLRAAAFRPSRAPRRMGYANLRNHRKILVVDGRVAFTGGTNIREDHWLKLQPKFPVACLHFRFVGPVAAHLQEAFAIDWAFTCGESLLGERWFPDLPRVGESWCRGISHGPDEDFEKITYTIMGALGVATQRIRIVTPYFIPNDGLIYALQLAAMKGLEVDIVLPEKNNIRLVQWASQAMWLYLLEKGCRIFLSPAPFDHTKLMVVDDMWSLVGSTNWDARSLRLNFEFNVECYDINLSAQLNTLIDHKINTATQISLQEVRAFGLPKKIRNGLARVLSPYL